MKRLTLFDYGAGNLHSLGKALAETGHAVEVESDPRAALDTDLLVLPGVGAFQLAAARLAPAREAMRTALEGGLPAIGICLGMQLFFDESAEGPGRGLGVIPGRVHRLTGPRVPHIGWNSVNSRREPAFARAGLEVAYFAHSFVCQPVDQRVVTAWTAADNESFPAAVRSGSVAGVQFHPEKSSREGVAFLAAMVEEALR